MTDLNRLLAFLDGAEAVSWSDPEAEPLRAMAEHLAAVCAYSPEDTLAALERLRRLWLDPVPPEVVRSIEARCGELTGVTR